MGIHNPTVLTEGKIWHIKANDIGRSFLPPECNLMKHISQSFNKNYAQLDTKMRTRKVTPKATRKSPLAGTIVKNANSRAKSVNRQRKSQMRQEQRKKPVRKKSKTPEIEPSLSSDSSLDGKLYAVEYFRNNFTITSNELYGHSSDEENKKIQYGSKIITCKD